MINQIEPWIDEEELKEVVEVIRSTWLTEADKTRAFEAAFRRKTGAGYARALCNGTLSLFAALKILGVGQGDEVILPDLTFVASCNAVILAGATPVLADVDKNIFTLCPDSLREKITPATRAVMPVHLYGQAADMDAIMKIAMQNNLFVIEDAAQAVGVKFNHKHVGTFGDFGCFSFYGNKTITTGEGGMIITADAGLDAGIYSLKNHGRSRRGTFVHDEIGFNFSFNELAAAIGLSQLRKLDRIIERKHTLRSEYIRHLSQADEMFFTRTDERCSPVHWFVNILVNDPASLQKFLYRHGIGTRRFFYPLHRQPCYRRHLRSGESFPNSDYAYAHGLSLPSSAGLEIKIVQIVCDKIKEFFTSQV